MVLPLIRGVDKGDYVKILFERGSKVEETREVIISDVSSVGDMTVDFDQLLALDVTLYQDSHAKYMVGFIIIFLICFCY